MLRHWVEFLASGGDIWTKKKPRWNVSGMQGGLRRELQGELQGELRELYPVEPYMRERFCDINQALEHENLGSVGLVRIAQGGIEAGMELDIGGHRGVVFDVGNGDLVMEASNDIKSVLWDLDIGLRAELVGGRGRDRVGTKVGNWRGGACEFVQLNEGWNADPNAPEPEVVVGDGFVELWVWPNRFLYPQFTREKRICIMFEGCTKYRMTAVNDHAWFDGQCRFSHEAPKWGEFYEFTGDTRDDVDITPWVDCLKGGSQGAGRHFHFYLLDEAFECKAKGWRLNMPSFHETGEINNV